jgi:hypothetical protein
MPSHRPYAGDPLAPPSVTQVLGLMDKPGLSWGAARETAKFAVHHLNRWVDLPTDEAVSTLARHHRGVWDHRALLGTAIHHINSEWCSGHTVRVADLVDQMCETSPLWRRTDPKVIYADLIPMADGLAECWLALKPDVLSYEQVVRFRDGRTELDYIGQTDLRARIAGIPMIVDLKTTGNVTPGKAKYWDTWRLQLAAYRYCTEAVLYGDADDERGAIELPEVDAAAVIHIYGNGKWSLEPLSAGPAEHEVFLALRKAYGWRSGEGKSRGEHAPVIWPVTA